MRGHTKPDNHASDYSGDSYYWFDRNNNTGVIGYQDAQAMTYTINITQSGNYVFIAKGLIGYDNQRGEHNDAWVKMSGESIPGEYDIPNDTAVKFYMSQFGWTYHAATKDEDQEPIRQYFSAGKHTVKIAGRSSDYCIDRFMLVHEDRWDELLKTGTKWNDNPSWGKNEPTLNNIAETIDGDPPPAENKAPVVNAGSNISVTAPATNASLNATVSDDGLPEGNSLTYSWTKKSGPDATINSPSSEDTTVTLTDNGTYVFTLTVSDGDLSASDDVTVTRNAEGGGGPGPLAGQIMIDPERGNYLVRNQDLDGDGELDPYMMAGVGGPEQFLYLGSRQSDGTRKNGRQQQIIDELVASGVNGIYIQSIRSFGGDAGSDKTQAPFNDYNDEDSGLDPDIMEQWHGWFEQFRDNDIGVLFFIYDDHAKPWGSSGDSVPAGEAAFITDLVNEFEKYPNVIFVIAEEYRFANFSDKRISNMAKVVAAADDHDHVIGVHHNIGIANQFAGDENIKLYVQQADLRKGSDKVEKLHSEYGTDQGFDENGEYAYIMGEAFDLHNNLVGISSKRTELRQSMYATAMAGGGLTVFGAYEDEWGKDPIKGNLDDMGHLVEFFHTTPFNTLEHNDSLAHGDTDWVMADEGVRYIAYSKDNPSAMGVKGLPNGTYDLRWFDAKDGEWVTEEGVEANGDTAFTAPSAMNNDTVLEIINTGAVSEPAPKIAVMNDISVPFETTSAALDATVTYSGSKTLSYSWEKISGPSATIASPTSEDTTVTLSDAGVYVFRLTVIAGTRTATRDVKVTRKADVGDLVYAINAGGGEVEASDGITYEADKYHSSGDSYSKSTAISGTEDDELYYTERYAKDPATVDYEFPVTNGTFVVTLMWSENTGSGRIMDVTAEGILAIDNLDVVSVAGGTKIAYEQEITVTVEDGKLNLSIGADSSATEDYPNIMAIRINSSSGGGTVVRSITMTNADGFIWDINPDDGTTNDDGSETTFDGLDAANDHELTPLPSAGG